jgi:cytochrome b561
MRSGLALVLAAAVGLLLLAYGAGWVASSGLDGRLTRAYRLHAVAGWIVLGLLIALPLVLRLAYGRKGLGSAPEEIERERNLAKSGALALGAAALAVVTLALGLLAERSDWSSLWHLAAASALASYVLGGVVLASLAVAARRRAQRETVAGKARPNRTGPD